MTTDYALKPNAFCDYTLIRNGKALYCPFSGTGEEPCGSWCPHFDITEAPNSANVRLYCVPTVRVIVIEKGSPE